jgi:hypothetical protein
MIGFGIAGGVLAGSLVGGLIGHFVGTDQQPGEVSPPYPLSFEANVLRPPKLQHAVQ